MAHLPSGVNVQIRASRPCRIATIRPSRVHAAETRSLAPSPAMRVLFPDVRLSNAKTALTGVWT